MDGIYGNPSSLHSVGQRANAALVNARERIAKLLECEAKEITFTSGGSKADNQAILSAASIVLGGKKYLLCNYATVTDFNWISGEIPQNEFRCKVKIRYRQVEQWATVTPINSNTVHINFNEPQWAITPGQAAVLYDGDVVLGGGTIK